VDGRRREVLPANHTLCGVVLEEGGSHRVEFRFESRAFRIGAAIAAAVLLLVAAYLFVAGPRRGDGAAAALHDAFGGDGA